ncbi:MAG: hypothetical protein A2521_15670 [Deltaproteobacteria bacterium RIFOXYD12_FULL_57_12]|nr:MAG: hypothetical protein A2521_15670 [Deltaproteobacteria bacterium RIFOXYD12_FULL_57_12]
MESLKGYFLISTPQMPDPRFQKRVVYLCVHSEEGAMGLVVNQSLPDIQLVDILQSAAIQVPATIVLPPVYMGGPVGLDTAFILYTSAGYTTEHTLVVSETVSLSADPQILRDIAQGRGPRDYLFTLGYSGWAPGQLENELTVDGWLPLPADDEILFHTPDELKWKKAAEKYGINITLFGEMVGSA